MATWSPWTNKKQYIPTSTRHMTVKRDKVEVYSKGPLVFWRFDHVIKLSRDKWKTLYFNFRETMSTKWLRVICLTTKPHILSITWLREFTWQMNSVISLHLRNITNYNKLQKIKNFNVILLKFVFSDIVNGYWMKFMAINAVTDSEGHLFFFIWKNKEIER